MSKERDMLKRAHTVLTQLKDEQAGLQDKVASLNTQLEAFKRIQLAEEIVFAKTASGALSFDDIQDFQEEVQRLAESDEDLAQVKLAMKHYGPQHFAHSLTEVGEAVKSEGTDKEASRNVPEGHKAAYAELDAALASLETED